MGSGSPVEATVGKEVDNECDCDANTIAKAPLESSSLFGMVRDRSSHMKVRHPPDIYWTVSVSDDWKSECMKN